MKALYFGITLCALLALAISEPPVSKRPLVYHNWPPKNGKQIALGRHQNGQKRTLVVQIRSDQPVPLVLKGRAGQVGHAHAQAYTQNHGHTHLAAHTNLHHHVVPTHVRGQRPMKLTAAHYYKNAGQFLTKPSLQKPFKIKLANAKLKSKPSISYDKPFKYEKPVTSSYTQTDLSNVQNLPLETHANFISDHFTPIHTIPAPNLGLHDNQLHSAETYLPPHTPKPQKYHATTTNAPFDINNHYQVVEDVTNDHTIRDPLSGSQKLFAPDPDPSLPAPKVRPAKEPFNQPSNGKPLPVDVQNNFVSPAQPLVQIVSAQQSAPEIYPIQYTQPAQYQQFGSAVQQANIPIYNPTYLVQQSNNLYTQHKQQLFRPESNVVQVGYVNADLTQEVASDGQILQAAKDPQNNIHPVLDAAPQFAALIAAPVLNEAQNPVNTAPFHLANIAAASATPEGGFIVSNYYNSPQDSSQLLQAYAEEEAQRQPLEIEQASFELQLQQQQKNQLDQLQFEQQQQQQQFEQFQLEHQQHQQQLFSQQQQNQLYQLQQEHFNQQHQQPDHQPLQQQIFDIEQRFAQQQPTQNSPLRIFVPDDESVADFPRLKKRDDNITRGTVEDVKVSTGQVFDSENSFEVTSSVEVSNDKDKNNKSSDSTEAQ